MGLFSSIGKIVGGVLSRGSEKKAFERQKKALIDQRKFLESQYDVKVLDRLVSDYDEKRAKRRLQFQEELEPQLAELRKISREQLLQEARTPQEARPSGQLAQQLFERVREGEPRLERFKEQLIDRAESELAAGAALPPEFQAELVRAGIQQGSQAGIGTGARAVGGPTARLLGSAGLQLQRDRERQALTFADAAQNISNARTSILASVFPSLKQLENQRIQQATAGLQVSEATLPETGLSGNEALGLRLQQLEGLLGVKKGVAQNRVQSALAKGAFQKGLSTDIGAFADNVAAAAIGGGALGAVGGIGGAGGGGGGLSAVGNILQPTQPAQPQGFDYTRFLKGLF